MDVKGRKHALMCKVYNSKLVKTCTVPNPRVGVKASTCFYLFYLLYLLEAGVSCRHAQNMYIGVWQPCDSFLEIQWSICLVLDIFRIRQTQGLNRPKMPIQWVPAPGIEAPSDAVSGGIDVNGTRIYVARAPHMGSLIPGKWRAACCWVR